MGARGAQPEATPPGHSDRACCKMPPRSPMGWQLVPIVPHFAHPGAPIRLKLKPVFSGIGIAPGLSEGGDRMPLAQITRPGLAAIALSVALLWSCVLTEHSMTRKALAERAQVMRQVVRSRQRTEPVSAPSRFVRRRPHPTAS